MMFRLTRHTQTNLRISLYRPASSPAPLAGSYPNVGTRNSISMSMPMACKEFQLAHKMPLQKRSNTRQRTLGSDRRRNSPPGELERYQRMATCDQPSDLLLRVAYPTLVGPGLRLDPRSAALPAERKERLAVLSNPQAKELGDIFYLIESRPQNPWAALASFAIMSILLLAIVVIPLLHTEILPKRETVTMLYAPPPPPPLGAFNATRLRTPVPATTHRATSISLPSPEPKTEEPPPSSAGAVGGVIGGVPGGVIGGVPGGVLGEVLRSTATAPTLARAPEPTPTKRVHLAARVVEANLVHDVAPTYPSEAGRARIEGTVVLWAVIGKDGSVQDVRIESGLPILAQAAIDAVKQWRYKPYLLNGEPVEVDSRITINFTLSS